MNKTSNNYPDHLYLLPLSSGTNHWCPPRWTNLVLKKEKKRRITADYSTTTALLPVTMREGWLQLARDSLCALVPCKEMARGSGALGSCTEVARDSVVALWSAACRDTPRYTEPDTPRY